jgi:hypothetical protein
MAHSGLTVRGTEGHCETHRHHPRHGNDHRRRSEVVDHLEGLAGGVRDATRSVTSRVASPAKVAASVKSYCCTTLALLSPLKVCTCPGATVVGKVRTLRPEINKKKRLGVRRFRESLGEVASIQPTPLSDNNPR